MDTEVKEGTDWCIVTDQNHARDTDRKLAHHRALELHMKSANIKRLKYLNFIPFMLKNLEKAENKYIRIRNVNKLT